MGDKRPSRAAAILRLAETYRPTMLAARDRQEQLQMYGLQQAAERFLHRKEWDQHPANNRSRRIAQLMEIGAAMEDEIYDRVRSQKLERERQARER